MDWRPHIRVCLGDGTGDPARDAEVVEELAQHLWDRCDDLRRRGLTAADAEATILAELRADDNLADRLRASDRRRPLAPPPPLPGGSSMTRDLWQDLRHAARMLARCPAFTIASLVTLALGIGMTTAIFSVVDAVLMRPVPFPEPHRLVMVWETDRSSGTSHEPASWPDLQDFRQRGRRLERLEALVPTEVTLTPEGAEPTRAAALAVTSRLLPMLGVTPVLGRTFRSEEEASDADGVLISDALWERAFRRDPRAVGHTLRLDDRPRTVVGVLPAGADFGVAQVLAAADYGRGFVDRDAATRVDIWMPMPAQARQLPRDTHPLLMLGRLAAGATVASAQEELAGIAADLEKAYRSNTARGVFITTLTSVVVEPIRPALLLLMGAVGMVLLISCANVASLLLARGTVRMREVAVRAALGADPMRLARQFVVENLLLTAAAGAIGVLLAGAALRALLVLAPGGIPRLSSVGLDVRVLALAVGVSVVVGLVFGLVPVLQSRRIDLGRALKADASRGATGGREARAARSGLIVAEVTLAVVLVLGAGLLIRSFWQLLHVNPGFDVSGVLKAEFQLPATRYPANFKAWPDFQEQHRFNAALLARVAALPGVEAAAIAGNHPLDKGSTNSFAVVGREAEARSWPEISIRRVTPGYFRVVRAALVGGRLFDDRDATRAPAVALVNEAAAERFFPGRDPIGQQLAFWGTTRTIVGVLANERFSGIGEAPPIAVYTPLAQTPSTAGAGALLVRTAGDPEGLGAVIGGIVREIDPGLAVFGVEPLADTLARSVSTPRFLTILLGIFAALALVLAAVGIHGVLSYTVAQRTREIGIRVAMGASPGCIRRAVLLDGGRPTAAGLAIGLVLGAVLARTMQGLLFGITAADARTYVAVPVVLGLVALVAMWLPTRRALKVDPLVALRDE